MADYFMQFSEMISDLTDEERSWIDEKMSDSSEADDHDDERYMDFDYELQDDGFWMYSEDGGNVDSAAYFVQDFLAKFRPEDTFVFRWSGSCSKPRIGEFSGGTILVSASDMKACDGSCVLKKE